VAATAVDGAATMGAFAPPAAAGPSVALRLALPEMTEPSGPSTPAPPIATTVTAAATSMAAVAATLPAAVPTSRRNDPRAGCTHLW
jgi:hypothetical protein